jgi:uncharacterized protein with GYD domain
MPTYIVLFNWTDQGIRTVKDSPSRVRQSEGQLRQLGITLRDLYLTMGDCDLVGVVEAPDDQAVARALLALGMQGNVRTKTFMAFTRAEFEQIAASLG